MFKYLFDLFVAATFFWVALFTPCDLYAVNSSASEFEEPSIGGFIADRFNAAKETTVTTAKKCVATAKQATSEAMQILGPLADSAYSCVKEIFKGAWSSTGGAVVDATKAVGTGLGKGAAAVVTGDAARAVGRAATTAANKTVDCVTSPAACASALATKIRNTASFIAQLVTDVKKAFANATPEQIRDIVCNIVGSLGAPILLAIATGGAGAVTALGPMKNIILTLQKLAKLGPIATILKTLNLPFDILVKLTGSSMDRVVAILNKDIKLSAKVRQAIISCQK